MESLSDILSGTTVPETNASAPPANAEPVKDDKPADGKADPAASATSAEQAKPDEKPEAKAEGEGEQTRDENGRFVKPDGKDEVVSLRKAMQAERKKRQELERQIAEANKPKDEKPKKDFWEDPEAALEERLSEREQKLRREFEAQRFNDSEEFARDKHADYDELISELMEETEADASLAQQVFSAAKAAKNPAIFLYRTAINRREMKAVGGDLGKYKETVTAPLRDQLSKLEKENKELKQKLDTLGKIPSSLNAQPSATRAAVESEAVENESLEEITKPRKRRA